MLTKLKVSTSQHMQVLNITEKIQTVVNLRGERYGPKEDWPALPGGAAEDLCRKIKAEPGDGSA